MLICLVRAGDGRFVVHSSIHALHCTARPGVVESSVLVAVVGMPRLLLMLLPFSEVTWMIVDSGQWYYVYAYVYFFRVYCAGIGVLCISIMCVVVHAGRMLICVDLRDGEWAGYVHVWIHGYIRVGMLARVWWMLHTEWHG